MDPTIAVYTSLPLIPPKRNSPFTTSSTPMPPPPIIDIPNEQVSNSTLPLSGPAPVSLLTLPWHRKAKPGIESLVLPFEPSTYKHRKPDSQPQDSYSQPPPSMRRKPESQPQDSLAEPPPSVCFEGARKLQDSFAERPPSMRRKVSRQPHVSLTERPLSIRRKRDSQPQVAYATPPSSIRHKEDSKPQDSFATPPSSIRHKEDSQPQVSFATPPSSMRRKSDSEPQDSFATAPSSMIELDLSRIPNVPPIESRKASSKPMIISDPTRTAPKPRMLYPYQQDASSLNARFEFLPIHDPFFSSQRVFGLDTTNFIKFLSHSPATLLMFYNSDNPKSQDFEQIVSQAACSTKSPDHYYAAVDCSTNSELCLTHNAYTLPMLRLYNRGFCLGEMSKLETISPDIIRKIVEEVPFHEKRRLDPCSTSKKR